MSFPRLPRHLLAERVHFSFEDRARIARCRRDYNRLGFAYQMAFLRLLGRFPRHQPIEILEDLLAYVAQRLDLNRAQQILLPAASTLRRLVIEERAAYRRRLFRRMMVLLPAPVCEKLDELLLAGDEATSRLQVLKEPPGAASPRALLKESAKLKLIEEASILEVDLSWIRSSLRKAMARRIRYSDAHRAYELRAPHRYTALACFLHETHAETARTLVEMHAKLMTQTFRRAQNRLNEKLRANRKALMGTLESFRTVTRLVLSGEVSDLDLRAAVLCSIPAERLEQQLADAEEWLTGSRSDVFPLVRQRFSYLRQFSPNGKLDDFFMPDDE